MSSAQWMAAFFESKRRRKCFLQDSDHVGLPVVKPPRSMRNPPRDVVTPGSLWLHLMQSSAISQLL
jgi:hypothetical protein